MSTPAVNAFSERYRTLADGELLVLAQQRQQLADAASAALDAELAARGLGREAMREFEEQTAARTEAEIPDDSDHLPPSTELPDDWFDEDAEATTGSTASSRPKGVTVCALLFWLDGITTAGWGGLLIIIGKLSSRSLMISLFAMIVGVALCMIGSGLWRLSAWARRFAEVFCWLCVALIGFNIVGNAYIRLRGSAVNAEIAIWQFLGLLWQALWALYLGRESTRVAFLAEHKKLGTGELSQ